MGVPRGVQEQVGFFALADATEREMLSWMRVDGAVRGVRLWALSSPDERRVQWATASLLAMPTDDNRVLGRLMVSRVRRGSLGVLP